MSAPIERLRELAEKVPERPKANLSEASFVWYSDALAYERARAEFWKAAFDYEHGQNFEPCHDEETYLEVHRIIASVRAKEQA